MCRQLADHTAAHRRSATEKYFLVVFVSPHMQRVRFAADLSPRANVWIHANNSLTLDAHSILFETEFVPSLLTYPKIVNILLRLTIDHGLGREFQRDWIPVAQCEITVSTLNKFLRFWQDRIGRLPINLFQRTIQHIAQRRRCLHVKGYDLPG
jgi:hypothetical protein